MKTKQFEKKLNLNKETIVDLDKKSMSQVYGGSHTDPPTGTDPKYVTELC